MLTQHPPGIEAVLLPLAAAALTVGLVVFLWKQRPPRSHDEAIDRYRRDEAATDLIEGLWRAG